MSLTAQLDALRDSLECKIDFVGQDLVERRARVILWASAAVAFVLGFALQNLKITFAIFTLGFLGCLAVCLPVLALLDIAHASNEQVTLPPLPAYNAHPVKWLDPLGEYGEVKSAVAAGGSSGAIEGKKGR
ncbi:Signal peptidase complex subunit 1 [Rhodotorula toruloides]|nr:Signal peptidase complex subunit 1 [Rhodotorula toruloides]